MIDVTKLTELMRCVPTVYGYHLKEFKQSRAYRLLVKGLTIKGAPIAHADTILRIAFEAGWNAREKEQENSEYDIEKD